MKLQKGIPILITLLVSVLLTYTFVANAALAKTADSQRTVTAVASTWDPITFDSNDVTYTLTGFGGAEDSTVVVDPTDPANNVARVVKSATAELWAGTTVSTGPNLSVPTLPFTANDTMMTVRVWSPDAGIQIRLKVEDAADPTKSVETEATTTVANEWETLTFNFANEAAGTAPLNLAYTYNKISIFFNFGVEGAAVGEKTYYFDDVTFISGGTPPPPPAWDTITFDDPEVTYTLEAFGGATSTVITDPTDAANNVAQFIKPAGAETWAGVTVATEPGFSVPALPFTADDTTMTVRFWSPDAGTPVLLKVEDATDGSKFVEVLVNTTVAGDWETLTFDFANPTGGALNLAYTYNKVTIFPNFGNTGVEKTYYFDDVTFEGGAPPPPTPWPTITFDSDEIAYILTGFGGADDSTVVVDPTDPTNNVARVVKSAEAELWAGTTVSTGPNNTVPTLLFTTENTTMTVRIWSPDAGIQIRLKVEDAADGSKSVETEATTTVANDWETLTFDFTNEAAGTPPLNLDYTYNRVSIFFNFGVPGAAVGEKIYYFDDMAFSGEAGPPPPPPPPPPPTWPPITFDSDEVTYTLTGFGGAEDSTVVVDPTDPANNVARVVKSATAELWAGTTVSTGPNLSVPTLPFTADDTTMTVRVWSPDAGIQIRLKVEDAADPTKSVETEATSTVANEWETLTFNFANEAAGTAPLNLSYTYNKISIFFNFGVEGAVVGEKTYYFDDVTFGGATPPPAPGSGISVIIDDFESGLPSGEDAYGNGIGFITWGDFWSGTTVAITTTLVSDDDPLALPGQSGDNHLLQFTAMVNGWGGLTHAFENEDVDTWVTQDWTGYEGISFWLYGLNTGNDLLFEIQDNRNPGSTGADVEIWSHAFVDDFSGWRLFMLNFDDDFIRKEIGNGAPNDGFGRDEVHGWAFGSLSTGGATVTYYLDNVALIVRTTIIDDFEDGLPTGEDAYGNGIGFVTWGDFWSGTTVAITTTLVGDDDPLALPGQSGDNHLLQFTAMVNGWGGMTHAFENEDVDTWVTQDWTSYEGIAFWLYGQNTGNDLLFEIQDNRNPGSTGADVEIWSHGFVDDFSGWRLFVLDFDADFVRKEIGNGAPNDGFGRDEVHGWAFGSLNTGGQTVTYYLDNVMVYGASGVDQPLFVGFTSGQASVVEGQTAVLTVALSRVYSETVTVAYATAESNARPYQFTPVSGTLTFPAGTLTQTISIETYHDGKHTRDVRVAVNLYEGDGAPLGFQRRAILTIVDIDPADPRLVDDFQAAHPFIYQSGDVELSITTLTGDSPLAVPGQWDYEDVLTFEFDGAASFGRVFAQGQDWSDYDGVSFWFYGQNSGDTFTFQLRENMAATTAEVDPEDWVLVWSDEFDGPAGAPPNPNVWKFELGDGALNNIVGWGNSEFQYYTDSTDNSFLDGEGNLVIRLQEADPDAGLVCWYGPCEYTSARLLTQDRLDFEYGRIEARVQVPDGPAGLWPAFWMLGSNIPEVGWPQSGEIDIMEYVSRLPYEVFGTIHGPGYEGGASFGNTLTFTDTVPNQGFLTYAVEWMPDLIIWYVDDIQYHQAVPADVAPREWVFNHPFFMLLNAAIGGNFGGPISGGMTFPQDTVVEYVRVYQAADTAERFEASFVDNFSGWQQITLPFAHFARSADQPDGAPDDGLTLTEVWGYDMILPADGAGLYHLDRVYLEFITYGVELTAETDALSGLPGETVTYTLTITNSGSAADSFAFTIDGNEWDVTLPADVTLAPGEAATVYVAVEIPATALGGAIDAATVTATSLNDPAVTATFDLTTLTTTAGNVYGLLLSPGSAAQSGLPGAIVTYTLTLTNSGNITDVFSFTADSIWTATVPAPMILAAGASADAVVTVLIPADAAGGASDTAVVTATSTGNNTLTAESSLTTTAANVYGLELSPTSDAQTGLPGATVAYTLTLTNVGNITDTFSFTADGEWDVTPPMSVTLASGDSANLVVTVLIPADAAGGANDTAVVTATSAGNNALTAESSLTTTAANVYGLELTAETIAQTGFTGSVVTYTLTLTNSGNFTDTFALSIEDNEWVVTLPDMVTVAAGEAATIVVSVAIPADATNDTVDTVTITAVSSGDPTQTANVELTTTAEVQMYHLYLPVILRP